MTTLAEAQDMLTAAIAAETEALLGKETHLSSPAGINRSDVQQDLRDIRKSIAYWRSQVALLRANLNGQPTFGGMTFSSADFGNRTCRE